MDGGPLLTTFLPDPIRVWQRVFAKRPKQLSRRARVRSNTRCADKAASTRARARSRLLPCPRRASCIPSRLEQRGQYPVGHAGDSRDEDNKVDDPFISVSSTVVQSKPSWQQSGGSAPKACEDHGERRAARGGPWVEFLATGRRYRDGTRSARPIYGLRPLAATNPELGRLDQRVQ